MSWVWPTLGSALCVALADFIVRKHLADLPLAQVVLVRFLGCLPVALIILWLVEIPPVKPAFWWAVACALPAEIAASLLYIKALQLSPLSQTQPFLVFTPLFATGFGFLFLGEAPSAAGFLGIAVLMAGAYGLNLHTAKGGWLGPIKTVGSQRGSLFMLAVAALYGYTSVLGRVAVLNSSPLFMAGFYLGVLAVFFLVWALFKKPGWDWLKRPLPAAMLCLAMAGMVLCHFTAMGMIQAAYMISLKRTSAVFAVFLGGVFLSEPRLRQNALATCLMVAGAGLIVLLG